MRKVPFCLVKNKDRMQVLQYDKYILTENYQVLKDTGVESLT